MTEQDCQRAAELERMELARIEEERAVLDAAAQRVRVTAGPVDSITLAMTSNCQWERRWGLALHQTRCAEDEKKEVVFRRHMKDLFPLTWQTPSALCA